jgi:hypothetical protein
VRRGPTGWRSQAIAIAAPVAIALVVIALLPAPAFAWTPGTHVFLGEAVLRSLPLLPASIAELLAAFPYDFLYGSIAADTSIAKKYAAAGRHCHAWHVGLEIREQARDEPLHAFALGYLAHLAADAVAHNYFVPRQLAITSSTAALGHSYWESRFETHLGERYARRARELILLDHARSDAHLDRILSPTIFSTPTNRRIFRGMVYVTDTEWWQRILQLMSEKSRWDLPDADVGAYLPRSFDFIVDFCAVSKPRPYAPDPSATSRFGWPQVRRAALRHGGRWWPPRRSDTSGCQARSCSSPCSRCSALSARASHQQLIHLPRIRAPAGFLHHRAHEHAQELLLASSIALPLGILRRNHLVDPHRELRLIAHLREAFPLRDLLGPIAGLDHQGENPFGRTVADRAATNHVQ